MVVGFAPYHKTVAFQEIKSITSMFFPLAAGLLPKEGKRTCLMDQELKAALDAIRMELQEFRAETSAQFLSVSAQFAAVRAQLNTLEYGVLTIAQKLLAEAEVRELKTGMTTRKKVAVG
jgi:hypothetical protein